MNNWVEDKEKICRLLFPVLRECVNTRDVTSLKYDKSRDVVVARISTCGKMKDVFIDVSCESGSAMVIDVMRRLM